MNIFVAVVTLGDHSPMLISPTSFLNYLPATPTATRTWRSSDSRVQLFASSVGPADTKGIRSYSDVAGVVDGILLDQQGVHPDENLDFWFESRLRGATSFEMLRAEGEFAVAWCNSSGFFATSNVGGSHNLFYFVSSAFVAVSNRASALLGMPGVSHQLDTEAIGWKALHGFVCEGRTAFNDIKRARNGALISVKSTNGFLEIDNVSYKDLIREDVRQAYEHHRIETFFTEVDAIARYMSRSNTFLGSPDIDLPLSGGKDSRAIMALLMRAGLMPKVTSIWTRGPLYSPEVLAAQDICAKIEFKHHAVRRPALASSSVVNARTVINIIRQHDGLLSLNDFCGIERRETMRFQGHELGLRAGRFVGCNTTGIESFVTSAIATFSNPLKVLRQPELLTDQIRNLFIEFYEQGCPVASLGDVYSTFDRLPSWAAVMSAVDYCGGHISNPLLLGRVVKFSYNIPASMARSEIFHYLTILRSAPELLNVPFAEQVWPESLAARLAETGLTGAPVVRKPYRSDPTFPNLRNPYVSNIKIEYFNVLKPIINELLKTHRLMFTDIIDVDKFCVQQATVTSPNFVYLNAALGVYSAAIIAEYGAKIFDGTQVNNVANDLQSRIDAAWPNVDRKNDNGVDDVWTDIVERHENSIASFVRQVHKLSESSSGGRPDIPCNGRE